MKNPNPYLEQVWATLPRVLALFDDDPTSPTFGQGDRYRWAWKLIDFGNGTFQGAAHGLARLLTAGQLPAEITQEAILRRIDSIFAGSERLMRSDGSMEEAFPFEASFCVTALVAYDLLSAIELLEGSFWERNHVLEKLRVIRPMVHFLLEAEESHAFISNHLATAATALVKWTRLSGEPGEKKGLSILHDILSEQSAEGWFREYQGADPGYQSLCTYYLADLHRLTLLPELMDSLQLSVKFLWYFAHPDGSYGGQYGSRNTRFYYPAGIEYLAAFSDEAASLAAFMRKSIRNRRVVALDSVDESNLVPMFNCYCWAAAEVTEPLACKPVPAEIDDTWRKVFKEAGLLIDKGPKHYTIISWHKGGVCNHFGDQGGYLNAGVVVSDPQEQLFSTQGYNKQNRLVMDGDSVTIEAPFTGMTREHPTPLQFVILRLLCLTVMRIGWLRGLIKKWLVRRLITGVKKAGFSNERKIELGPTLRVRDQQNLPGGWRLLEYRRFNAIHMASQGYWQIQDEGPHDSAI